MLKKYNQKANVIGANQTITDKVNALTRNSTINELFGLENEQDKNAVSQQDQFRPLTQDPVRAQIVASIVKEYVFNSENIISTYHYDASSVTFSSTASFPIVYYNNFQAYFTEGSNLSFICWFNINNYAINDIYNLFDYYDTTNSLGFKVTISNDIVNVNWNSTNYSMNLTNSLNEETWYSILLNIDQRNRKITHYIYKRDVDDEDDAEQLRSTILRQVYKKEQDLVPTSFRLETTTAKLLSGDFKITNIRLFSQIVPEEEINKILNQAILRDDTKYLILGDNSNKKLTLPNYPIGQIGDGEV